MQVVQVHQHISALPRDFCFELVRFLSKISILYQHYLPNFGAYEYIGRAADMAFCIGRYR